MYLLLYPFLYTVYFDVVTSHKVFFSSISTSSLSCAQRFFSKMKLVKTLLLTQLKQINLENCTMFVYIHVPVICTMCPNICH